MSARFRRCFATFVLILSGMIAAPTSFAQTSYTFNLPEQSLADSLRAIGQQTEMNILFEPEAVKNARSPAVRGQYTVDEAIRIVLAGTKLEAQHTAASNVVIKVKPSRSTALPATSVEGATRFAQANSASSQSSTEAQSASNGTESKSKEEDKKEGLTEIVVTGSHIRGVAPSSPMIVITSTDIENSGASTAGDVLRALPQSFAGGQQSTIGVNGSGPSANLGNFSNSDSANLRGFGSDSTLVLINGFRVPVTGVMNSVDISIIPLAAIDRVEIVTDGASAEYGSDAVGGVVNFILKKNFEGAETGAELSDPTAGGGISQRYSQLFGTSWGSGSALLSYQYRDQNGVYGNQRSWYNGPDPMTLIPSIHQNSVFINADQSLSSNLKVFTQLIYNHTSSDAVSADAGTPIVNYLPTVGYTYGATVGATATLAHDWQVTATGTYGADRFDHLDATPATEFSADLIPTNRTSVFELGADGPVIGLPTGEVRAAVGGGYRQESFVVEGYQQANADRHLEYTYGELTVPLVGNETSRPGIERVALTLAGRYEKYSDFGNHFSPQVGLIFEPTTSTKLRSTWSTSFLAPSLYERNEPNQVYLIPPAFATNPAAPSSNSIFWQGGSASLRPETARSITFGVDFKPSAIPNLALSGTYFNIHYNNLITQPNTNLGAAFDPVYASLITLNPSPAAQQIAINSAGGLANVGNYTGSPYNPSTIGAIIDDRFQNAAKQLAQGVDLSASLRRSTDIGVFSPFLSGTYLDLREQLTNSSPLQTLTGLVFYPPRFKLRGGLTWERSGVSATGIVSYSPGSSDNLVTPQYSIGSWTTVDFQAAYALNGHGFIDGLTLRLSLLNVLDKTPPFVRGYSLGYDATQASALGRIVKLEVSKKW